MKFVPKDWSLHLLALILAVVVYYVIKSDSASANTSNYSNDSSLLQSH